MKFVTDTIYRSKIMIEIEEGELDLYKHCIEQRRAFLSRTNENRKLVAQIDSRLKEIDRTLADMKRKRTLRCVS